MSRFGQHTKLVATAGQGDALVAKFLESAEIQRDNPACGLMIAGSSTTEEDVVYLVEVWASDRREGFVAVEDSTGTDRPPFVRKGPTTCFPISLLAS